MTVSDARPGAEEQPRADDRKRAQRLEKLGMVRCVADECFQENLAAARVYFEEHRTLCAPRSASALDKSVRQ
ncbi:hypothetical protein ACFWOJ_36135 [Streptomyces sp. NPDC058439]|uniref:hypothetical protein n=1 Tax=Streptomyces sp. NPDC058439 TaxID=3346500 RepID=UPI00364F1D36